MTISTILEKMSVELGPPVRYLLRSENDNVSVNELIGSTLNIQFSGDIFCPVCSTQVKKLYQGFCYDCFVGSPEASECILRPELCKAQDGIGRDMDWETRHHLQTHYVYLAKSSGIKVGVTRSSQVPTRWIDQGASEAVILAETPNRYLAGCIEVFLKQYLTDKTHWQRMLKNEISDIDLLEKRAEIAAILKDTEYGALLSDKNDVSQIVYPVETYPEKVKSVNLDKLESISGVLVGVKGQYLLFEGGTVFNVRRHSGYKVVLLAA